MVGLILLYFVGKAFFELADKHNRSRWGYAILGVASYYIGTFVGGVILAVFYEFVLIQSIDDVNDLLLGLMALPVGVLSCWGLYQVLKSQWSKPKVISSAEDVLDGELINPLL